MLRRKERHPGAAGSDSGGSQKGEARGKAFPLARAPSLPQGRRRRESRICLSAPAPGLLQVLAEQAGEAEQAVKRAESAVAEATNPNPDEDAVEYSVSRL